MALSLPNANLGGYLQPCRRSSLFSKFSPSPPPPPPPSVTSTQLANEVIKKLLQLQLLSRMENLSIREDDYPSQQLSPSISPSHYQIDSGLHLGTGRSLYKTEICKRYLMNPNSACEYGARCRFAHGLKELHLTARHPRYKTEHCRAFQLTGSCRYGKRCDFIHNETEYELELMRTENALYQEYCMRHPTAKHVTLLEVLREFGPSRPDFSGLLNHFETH